MMFHVITLEGDGGRNSHGQVRKNSVDLVPGDSLSHQAMTRLVHGESETMVDGSGESVAAEDPGVPGCSLEEVKGE